MSAMCRKCLKSASDESRRCSSCGGRIVRFSDNGDVVEVDAAGDEPRTGGGVPPLFGNLETSYVLSVPVTNGAVATVGAGLTQAPPMYGPAPGTNVTGSSFGGAVAGSVAPPNGYCQPPVANGQPEVPAQVSASTGPANAGFYAQPAVGSYQVPVAPPEDHGLAPPLPMGYTDFSRPASSARPAGPAAALLLPVTQLDDVVAEMLQPFGFERPAPVVEPPPPPPPFLVEPQHILGKPQDPPESQIAESQIAQPQVAPQPEAAPQPLTPAPRAVVAPAQVADPIPPLSFAPSAPSAPTMTAPQSDLPVAAPSAPAQPVEQAPVSPELSVPGPDLITSSSEPRTKKDRQRRERDVSMAELARDIISISEQESVPRDADEHGEHAQGGAASPDEAARHASFDLVLGPAPKSGRLRRSKIPTPKDAAEELADLVSDSGLNTAAAEANADKGRTRSRLRHR